MAARAFQKYEVGDLLPSRAIGSALALLDHNPSGLAVLHSRPALAKMPPGLPAQPPAGFVPLSAPGRVVKVNKSGCLEANRIFPKVDDAREMLRRALEELTGQRELVDAVKAFVHPQDKVCVKVNGIALQNMATNKELVLPFVQAMIAAGVPAANITVLEQYPGFMNGTRINAKNVPAGVSVVWHSNNDATMDWRDVPGTQRHTKFVRPLTEATALITKVSDPDANVIYGIVTDDSMGGAVKVIAGLLIVFGFLEGRVAPVPHAHFIGSGIAVADLAVFVVVPLVPIDTRMMLQHVVLRAERIASLRSREKWRERGVRVMGALLPGAAGLLARRPLCGLLGAIVLCGAVIAAGVGRDVVPDPLAVGATRQLVFAIAATLLFLTHAGVSVWAFRHRRD